MIRSTLLFCTLTTALFAQETTATRSANSFIPANARCEVVINMAALVESGLIDDLQSSPIGMMLGKMKEDSGVDFETLSIVRAYPDLPKTPDDETAGLVVIVEGKKDIPMPEQEGFEKGKIGGMDVMINSEADEANPMVFLDAAPRLKVFGSKQMLGPLLDGSKKSGTVPAALTAMASGKNTLFSMTAMTTAEMFGEDSPFAEGSGMAAPQLGMLRLRTEAASEDDEPEFVLELVGRFEGGEAAGKLVEMINMQLGGMMQSPQGAMMKPMLDKVKIAADGKDAKAVMKLGTSREFVGLITQMGMMFMGGMGGR